MRKSYVCFACRDGKHLLCASDLNPKNVCTCDEVWHIEIDNGQIRKFKGMIWEPPREAKGKVRG